MSYRFIDYNEMLVKPADVDVVAIFDIDAGPGGELKKIKFGTWKSFFVMRDENTDIAADHEYQTNKKLKHGSAGEYEQYHDATDMYFVSTKSGGEMIFKVNSTVKALTITGAGNVNIYGWLGITESLGVGTTITAGDTIATNTNITAQDTIAAQGTLSTAANLGVGTTIVAGGTITSNTKVIATSVFRCAGNDGVTFNGAVATLNVKGGIVIGHT